MKTIFGKLSILCFFAVIIGLVISYRACMILDDDPMGMVLAMFYFPILFTPLGFLFCFLSARKKESPSCCRHIGFVLNCLSFLLFFYVSIGPMIFGYSL
jgi:hypothetical protein